MRLDDYLAVVRQADGWDRLADDPTVLADAIDGIISRFDRRLPQPIIPPTLDTLILIQLGVVCAAANRHLKAITPPKGRLDA